MKDDSFLAAWIDPTEKDPLRLPVLDQEEETPPFMVSDLKQWCYCPRLVYFACCLPAVRPTTFKMEAGREAGEVEVHREKRRSLRVYGLQEGERLFDVWVSSRRLGLRGRVDMVIRREEEAIPVDYKLSRRMGKHVRLQLAAYGMMLEEQWEVPVRRGFLYSLVQRRAEEIRLTARLRQEVEKLTAAMQAMLRQERMPPPASQRGKCVSCEFRRFCNDVV